MIAVLRALIIEDETPARDRLARQLAAVTPAINVAGRVDSVAATDAWLRTQAAPDLIFADIQLGDGRSLDYFRGTPPPCPVVFVTAHDEYLLEAFAAHGIAYLLKPVKPADLEAAVAKYRQLGRHFAASLAALAASLAASPAAAPVRQRILAQRGPAFQPFALAEVAYFLSENKLTFLVSRAGERCLVNETLGGLAGELAAAGFFRVNRNVLAHVGAVRSFAPVGKGRLSVQLLPRPRDEVLVCQENAAAFRAWIGR